MKEAVIHERHESDNEQDIVSAINNIWGTMFASETHLGPTDSTTLESVEGSRGPGFQIVDEA